MINDKLKKRIEANLKAIETASDKSLNNLVKALSAKGFKAKGKPKTSGDSTVVTLMYKKRLISLTDDTDESYISFVVTNVNSKPNADLDKPISPKEAKSYAEDLHDFVDSL